MKPITMKIILFYIKVLCVIHREQLLFNLGTIRNTGVRDAYRLQILLTIKLTAQTQNKIH
jgi:hypothetical protein